MKAWARRLKRSPGIQERQAWLLEDLQPVALNRLAYAEESLGSWGYPAERTGFRRRPLEPDPDNAGEGKGSSQLVQPALTKWLNEEPDEDNF